VGEGNCYAIRSTLVGDYHVWRELEAIQQVIAHRPLPAAGEFGRCVLRLFAGDLTPGLVVQGGAKVMS
jgi:hypothetical protein